LRRDLFGYIQGRWIFLRNPLIDDDEADRYHKGAMTLQTFKSRLVKLSATLLLLPCVSPLGAESLAPLDGAEGRVLKVDPEAQTFEFLKATEYDPKTDIGRSRFTVHWEDDAKIIHRQELKSFDQITAKVLAEFRGINDTESKALQAGEPFTSRIVTLYPGAKASQPTGLSPDNKAIIGWFTPDREKKTRGGRIKIGGKQVPVALRKRFWRIYQEEEVSTQNLAKGFWRTKINGVEKNGKFLATRLDLTAVDDPRKTDHPRLPRVLVIGDSISMNYHESAKAALKGIANYHRNYGNSFASRHGVLNAELWLGNYEEKGFHWDVIQFNHGLHDLKQTYDKESDSFGAYATPLAKYKANLEEQIGILKKTGATLIWCQTTPVQSDTKSKYARREGAAKVFNQAALEVMSKHPDIIINDLHGLVSDAPEFKSWWKTTNVHFYQKTEQKTLGEAVARSVKKALAERAK
jgi:hypothetical protein